MLAASIRVGIFGKRDSINEALEYASEIIDNLQTYDKAVVYTALHVMMNTIADEIDALPDSSTAVLEPPPAEVRIDYADLPATGEPLLTDRITDIVDQRIKFHTKDFDRRIEESFNQLIEDYDLEDVVKNIIRNMSFSIDVD